MVVVKKTMSKPRRYVRPRVEQAIREFKHVLDEAILLSEVLILQQAGTRPERFRAMNFKKASIDSLNDVLLTLKSLIKKKLPFLMDVIDRYQEEAMVKITSKAEFARIIIHCFKLNLIADNSNISLYLAPYIEEWELLSFGVQAIVLNHVIKSINRDIERAHLRERIAKKFK